MIACYLSTFQEGKAVVPKELVYLVTTETPNKRRGSISLGHILVSPAWKAFSLSLHFPLLLGKEKNLSKNVPWPLLSMELITFPLYFYMSLVSITTYLLFILIAWTVYASNWFKHYLDIYSKNRSTLSSLQPLLTIWYVSFQASAYA